MRRRVTLRGRLPAPAVVVLVFVLALALAGCGGVSLVPVSARPCRGTCAGVLAQNSADTYASVARRIYGEEVYGAPNGAAFEVISRVPGLIDGLTRRDYKLARYAMHHQPIRHAVAVRVTRGSRTLIDVGLRFVVGGRVRELRDAAGVSLGRIEVSIQDVVGFMKLINRLTGCQVVVRGSIGLTSSLPAAATVALPRTGPVTVGVHHYIVSSFQERGFAGEPLLISVLAPASRLTAEEVRSAAAHGRVRSP